MKKKLQFLMLAIFLYTANLVTAQEGVNQMELVLCQEDI